MRAFGTVGPPLVKLRPHVLDQRERAAATVAVLRTVRRAVFKREGGKCRACQKKRCIHLHHIVYRSHGGVTATWACVGLCKECHQDIHAKLLQVSAFSDADRPDGITFERVR